MLSESDGPASKYYQVELVPEPRWRRFRGRVVTIVTGLAMGDAVTHVTEERARIIERSSGRLVKEIRGSLLDATDVPRSVNADLAELTVSQFRERWLD